MARKRKAPQVEDSSIRNPGKHLFDFTDALDIDGKSFHRYKFNVMRYYYEHTSKKDLFDYISRWMKTNGYTKDQIEHVELMKGLKAVPPNIAVYAKLLASGCPERHPGEEDYIDILPCANKIPPLNEVIRTAIEKTLTFPKPIKEEPEEQPKEQPKVSIQERMLEQVSALLDSWELRIDNLDFDFDPYRELLSHTPELKPAHISIMQKELSIYNDIRTDPKYADFFKRIDNAMGMVSDKKKVSKPRKKKEVSNDKLIEKLQYQQQCLDLSLVSIYPGDIIGSTVLYTYNTKNKQLSIYCAPDGGSLSVKGTTIIGYDELTSIGKTLRKPAEQLAEFKGLTKAKQRKYLSTITTKQKQLNGRINKDTILLAKV